MEIDDELIQTSGITLHETSSSKKQMISFLFRILDKNKPMFVFNTTSKSRERELATPSFRIG